jgi:hypothetical protein
MRDDSERIKYAQWVLERTLTAIGAAEVKLSVVITINLAMLGGLGNAFTPHQSIHDWHLLTVIVASTTIFASLICCALALIPRMQGPERSFIFFGRIGKRLQKTYFTDFSQAGEDAILNDLLAQIHRNSEIACKKFDLIRISMLWSFVSIPPWFVSMITVLYK